MFLCGIDSLQVYRMKKKLLNQRFIERVFSPYEIEYINKKSKPYETAAGLWCAKEAFLKAYGTGIENLDLCEIGIIHNEKGVPNFKLTEKAKKDYPYNWASLSITHTSETATAMVILQK